jgi:hypothetical protein
LLVSRSSGSPVRLFACDAGPNPVVSFVCAKAGHRSRFRCISMTPAWLGKQRSSWRKGWDSNPRYPCGHAGFQDRCLKPLGHPSKHDRQTGFAEQAAKTRNSVPVPLSLHTCLWWRARCRQRRSSNPTGCFCQGLAPVVSLRGPVRHGRSRPARPKHKALADTIASARAHGPSARQRRIMLASSTASFHANTNTNRPEHRSARLAAVRARNPPETIS